MLNFLATLRSAKEEDTPPSESEDKGLLDEIRRRDDLIREQEERTRTLEDQNKRLQDELEEKRRQIEEQEKIIEDLREELRQARFGPRSERRPKPKETKVSPPGEDEKEREEDLPQVPNYVSEQAKLLSELKKKKTQRRAEAKKANKEKLGKVSHHIPTRSTYTILPTVGNLCPHCHESLGAPLKQEESTKLCKCPYRVERIVMYRVSSLCRACGTFFYSSTPEDPFPKSGFDASVVADVAVEKFVDGVPLHRQAQAFERDGILVSEDALEELILKGAALLGPTYEHLLKEVKDSPILASDQTRLRVRVLGEDGVSRYVQGSLSLSVNLEGDVALVAAADQKKESCEAAIGDKVEILVSDAAAIFSSIAEDKGMKEANCASHARRKFFQARHSDPVLADRALDFFAALYAVEATADLKKVTHEERRALRQEYSRPVLADFRRWCEEVTEIREKDEKLRKAVDYMLCRWEKFERYLDDGRIPIDTNSLERRMKLIARARKNFLHCSSLEGARACAIFFSLIFTCESHHINPVVYLTDVLKRAAVTHHSEHRNLIPKVWKELYGKDAEHHQISPKAQPESEDIAA